MNNRHVKKLLKLPVQLQTFNSLSFPDKWVLSMILMLKLNSNIAAQTENMLLDFACDEFTYFCHFVASLPQRQYDALYFKRMSQVLHCQSIQQLFRYEIRKNSQIVKSQTNLFLKSNNTVSPRFLVADDSEQSIEGFIQAITIQDPAGFKFLGDVYFKHQYRLRSHARSTPFRLNHQGSDERVYERSQDLRWKVY